jgi:hypothetical protein
MARIIVTMLAALTMLYVGIQALAFREATISTAGLSGADQEAFNMTRSVVTDATAITGNALPRLFIIVLVVLLISLLVLTR